MPLEAVRLDKFPNIKDKQKIANSLTALSKKYEEVGDVTDLIGGLSGGDEASCAVLTDALIAFIVDYLQSASKLKSYDELFEIFAIDHLRKIKSFAEHLYQLKDTQKSLAWAEIMFASPPILPDDFYARSIEDLIAISKLDLRYLKRMNQFLLMINPAAAPPLPLPLQACVSRINQLLSHYNDVDSATAALIDIYDVIGIEALTDDRLDFSKGIEEVISKSYLALSRKIQGSSRKKFINLIDQSGGDNKEIYIEALNKIFDKPQLTFAQIILDYLKNEKWFSLSGLKKLDEITNNPRYFEPKGLRFLNDLDVERLTDDNIELLKGIKNLDELHQFKHLPKDQTFHAAVISLLDKKKKLNDLSDLIRATQVKKSDEAQSLPNSQPPILTKQQHNAKVLKEDASLISGNKFIYDSRNDDEDEASSSYIVKGDKPFTANDLAIFRILSSGAEKGADHIFHHEDLNNLNKNDSGEIQNPYNLSQWIDPKDFHVVGKDNLDLNYLNNLLGFRVTQMISSENGLSPEKNALLFFLDKIKSDTSLIQKMSPQFFEEDHLKILADKGVVASIVAYPALLTSAYGDYGYVFTATEMVSLLSEVKDEQSFRVILDFFAKKHPDLFYEFCTRDDADSIKLRQIIYLSTFDQIDADNIQLPEGMYEKLREKYKSDLIAHYNVQDEYRSLTEFKKAHDAIFNSLRDDLNRYEKSRLYRKNDGTLAIKTFSITKPERLVAYEALDKAVETRNFQELFRVIKEQKYNIDLEGPLHKIEGLQEYVRRVNNNYLLCSFKFRLLFEACQSDDQLLGACLLDDTFYNYLSTEKLFLLAEKKQQIVFELLSQYRPEALARQLENSKSSGNKKLGELLQPPKRIPKIPTSLEGGLYQWQDLDLTVALHQLATQENNVNIKSIVLPLGQVEDKNHLLHLQTALSKRQNHLIISVCHINADHYVLIVAHRAENGKNAFIVIDPAYDNGELDNDKQKTKTKIISSLTTTFGKDCNIQFPDVIQQFDGSSCAIACVQTVEDILAKPKMIGFSKGELKLDESLLTLNAYRYCGEEKEFQDLLTQTRRKFEEKLSTVKESFGFYYEFELEQKEQFKEFPQGNYSIKDNQALQNLLQDAKDLLNQLIGEFRDQHEDKIKKFFPSNYIHPQLPSACKILIDQFLKGNANFEKYTAQIQTIQEINNQFQSEKVNIDLNTPEKYLEKAARQIDAEQKIEKLCKIFYQWQKEQRKYKYVETGDLMPSFQAKYPAVGVIIAYAEKHDVHFDFAYKSFCENKRQEEFVAQPTYFLFGRPPRVKKIEGYQQDAKKPEKPAAVVEIKVVEERNEIIVPSDDAQPEVEVLKKQLIDALKYLQTEMGYYPTKPQLNLFTGLHTRQNFVKNLMEWSDIQIKKIQQEDTVDLLKGHQFEMAGKLFLDLQKLTRFHGQYSDDPFSLHRFVRAPLAAFMGMTKDEINRYDLETQAGWLALQDEIENRIGALCESLNISKVIEEPHEFESGGGIKLPTMP